MVIVRRSDWEARLSAYLAERIDTVTFQWGLTDCALYAADGILAMTDTDIAAAYRGKYSTAAGSIRALKRYGGGSLKETVDAALPAKPIGYARRGDVVMSEGAVGLCIGADALFVRADEPGLERIERARWMYAWSVG